MLRALLFTYKFSIAASLVNCVGMLPVSLLSSRYSCCSKVRVESSLGMVPEMALPLRSTYLPVVSRTREKERKKGGDDGAYLTRTSP